MAGHQVQLRGPFSCAVTRHRLFAVFAVFAVFRRSMPNDRGQLVEPHLPPEKDPGLLPRLVGLVPKTEHKIASSDRRRQGSVR
jgi:hypothetical protein